MTTPITEKSTLDVLVKGSGVCNALFRAELKKELTFFRGCGAKYKSLPQ